MPHTWTYNVGEQAVQQRAGAMSRAERNASAIHTAVPGGAAAFLAEQPFVVIGAAGDEGRVWCSLVNGCPGFAHAVDEHTVRVSTRPPADDPLSAITVGSSVGMIAIEPPTRARVRFNGTVRSSVDEALLVDVDEVVANCPKHITPRDVTAGLSTREGSDSTTTVTALLTPRDVRTLTATDTLFLATVAPGAGADASHRGGPPGFVTVVSKWRVEWPDFLGNAMFLSFGNLEVDGRAGLLVVDWMTGATLQLTGRAHVRWEPDDARTVVFDIEQVRARKG